MKKLALIIIATFFVITAYSAYLKNVPMELKQPDGSASITNNVSNDVSGLGKKMMPNQRPVVADNSKWFPPAEMQIGPVCSYFSRIYYLKSYLWNRHFNRDPKLPENQFSPYFAWNQNIATTSHFSQGDGALRFMRNQGCCSVKYFDLIPDSEEIMPALGAKENALSFKSKPLQFSGFSINGLPDSLNITNRINELKDSLVLGNPCVMNIPNFYDLWIKHGSDLIMDCSKEVDWSIHFNSHDITVVGYNDTIKTKYGRGAFKLLNSNGIGWGNNGYAYMAYDWFYQNNYFFAVDFLEENFDYQPDILLNLNIKNTISDVDRSKYFFVDTIYNYPVMDTTVHDFKDKKVDFPSGFGSLYPNTFRIKSINGRKRLTEDEGNYMDPNPLFFNRMFVPQHNHSGDYEILNDLTECLNGESFKSCEILINDPISATFIGDNDQQLFSFVREPQAEVSTVFIKSLKSNFIIIGNVTELADTTIICSDYYSALDLLGRNLTPFVDDDYIHIKQSTAKLRRKKISFNIADRQTNIVPIANAGSDQIVREGATVSLDGSGSYDPVGSQLTYKWKAPKGITLSSSTAKNPTFSAPPVLQDTQFVFSLVVNDGTSDSPADEIVITETQNDQIPEANVGFNILIPEGAPFTLDGSASFDPYGKPLTYKWTAPVGITLNSLTIARPSFTAPEVSINTNFEVSLVVSNGIFNSCIDQLIITVKNMNKIPIANAGTDQTLIMGTAATLDGSQSLDLDNELLTYKWTSPAGIILSSTSAQKPTFIAPQVSSNTTYTFTLVVNDGTVDSPADQVFVTVKNQNQLPVANAGVNQNVNEGNLFTLDGSQSNDPDSDPLNYKWIAPVGISLSSTTVANPTFTAPEVSEDKDFILTLIVNDGIVDSPPTTIKVTVLNTINVGVSNLESPLFNIYPNPTAGIITLEFIQSAGKKREVSVSNILGVEVFRKKLIDVTKSQVDITNNVSGIYMLKVTIDKQQYFSKIVLRK